MGIDRCNEMSTPSLLTPPAPPQLSALCLLTSRSASLPLGQSEQGGLGRFAAPAFPMSMINEIIAEKAPPSGPGRLICHYKWPFLEFSGRWPLVAMATMAVSIATLTELSHRNYGQTAYLTSSYGP